MVVEKMLAYHEQNNIVTLGRFTSCSESDFAHFYCPTHFSIARLSVVDCRLRHISHLVQTVRLI